METNGHIYQIGHNDDNLCDYLFQYFMFTGRVQPITVDVLNPVCKSKSSENANLNSKPTMGYAENRMNELHLGIAQCPSCSPAQVTYLGIFFSFTLPSFGDLKKKYKDVFGCQSQAMVMECLSAIKLKPGCPFLFALRRVNHKLKLVQLKLIPVIAILYQRWW